MTRQNGPSPNVSHGEPRKAPAPHRIGADLEQAFSTPEGAATMTDTASEATSGASTEQIWYAASSSGTPAEPKVGPGDPSLDIARAPDPWNVLRFRRGFLTIDTADKHYPEWRKWLEMSAGGSGLRIVTQAERDAIEHVATDAEWADLEARHAAAVALRR